MEKIKIMFDYGTNPIWVYDAFGEFQNNGLPEEFLKNQEIVSLVVDLEIAYTKLFIDNEESFGFIGFSDNKQKKDFELKVKKLKKKLEKEGKNKYCIEIKRNYL